MMSDTTVVPLRQPDEIDDPLTAVLRSGARRLLAQAIEAEAEAFLAEMKGARLPDGRERVVRHGHAPERLVQTGIDQVKESARSLSAGEAARPRRRRWSRAHPFHLGHPAALGAADPEPGCPAADPLPARGFDGRLPGGARGAAGQRCAEPVAVGGRAAARRVGSGLCALAAARPVGPALRLCLGGRRLPAGAHGATGRMHAGADRRHAGGQEGTPRLPGRHAGERAELAGTAGRPQGARPGHRARTGHRRRGARLLESARGGFAGHPASALHRAQNRQRARQAAPVRPAGGQGRTCARSGRRRTVRRPRRRSRRLPRSTGPNTPRRPPAWSRTATRCWPSTTSRPSTGTTCAPPTRSRACSPPCGTAPSAPRARCRRTPPG